MKFFFFLLIYGCFAYTTSGGKLDECSGIGSFTFGAPKEQYKNMTLEIEQGNSQLYTADSGALKVEGVQFDYLGVSFIKNKLSAISVSTKNSTGAAFFKFLKDNYGAPIKNKNMFEWRGMHITIVLELYKNNKDATVDFYS